MPLRPPADALVYWIGTERRRELYILNGATAASAHRRLRPGSGLLRSILTATLACSVGAGHRYLA
jgi:hypothetical protein